jgi:gas vesicle protein
MERDFELDGGMLTVGLLVGMATGALVALFTAPKTGRAFRAQVSETGQQLRSTVTPPDTIAESMAEGKAAARRRRAELGIE